MKYILMALILILGPISFSYAQTDFNIGGGGLTIDTEPLYVGPDSDFTASLNDYSFPAQINSIKWKVDSLPVPEATNKRSVSLINKGAGKKTVIEATIELVGGSTQTVKKTVDSTHLDIVVEPQTRTPAFYKGRSLPSVGSQVNLIALVNGNSVSKSDLIFNWRINNTSIDGGPMRGKNNVTITIPVGKYVVVTLDINNLNGDLITRRSIQIPAVSPQIYFYEVNSIYGQSHKIIKDLNLVGDSTKVIAEPYNLDIITYNSPDILEWKINDYQNPRGSGNPYEVTLAKENQTFGGVSTANFHVRNIKELLQGAQGSFKINF